MKYIVLENMKRPFKGYIPWESVIPDEVKDVLLQMFPKDYFIHRNGSCWIVSTVNGSDFDEEDLIILNSRIGYYTNVKAVLTETLPSSITTLVFDEHASGQWLKKAKMAQVYYNSY